MSEMSKINMNKVVNRIIKRTHGRQGEQFFFLKKKLT